MNTFNLHVKTSNIPAHKDLLVGGDRREFLQEKALTNNVIVCDSQKNNSLGVHVLNYKGNTSQPEKKQLILYAVKDVVDHSIHS